MPCITATWGTVPQCVREMLGNFTVLESGLRVSGAQSPVHGPPHRVVLWSVMYKSKMNDENCEGLLHLSITNISTLRNFACHNGWTGASC